jgi:Ran GTPase-activating protein (RanGAP) involved in mRNA processing and transport
VVNQQTAAQDVVCPVPDPVHTDDSVMLSLQPLLAHLASGVPNEDRVFPAGTLRADGRLDLCKQHLGVEGCTAVVNALRQNAHIESILMGTDGIGDTGAGQIAELIGENTVIRTVYLGCNAIGSTGAGALATALAENQSVTGLWLKRNPIGDAGVRAIAAMLAHNQSLRVLDLVNTGFTRAGLSDLVDMLCSTPHRIERLYLSGNGLEAEEARLIGRLLCEAPGIAHLALSVNRIGDVGASVLAEALQQNQTLQTLGLASNGIGPRGLDALAEPIRAHPSLYELDLGFARSTRVLGAQANDLGDGRALERLLSHNAALLRLDLRGRRLAPTVVAVLARALEHNDTLIDIAANGVLPGQISNAVQRNRARPGARSWAVSPEVAVIQSAYR